MILEVLCAERHVHGARLLRRTGVARVVEDADLGAGPRAADGARMAEPLVGRDERAAALARRVVLVDHGAPPREHPPLHVHGAGRGGVDHVAERGHVEAGLHGVRQREQPVKLRRHHVRRRDAILRDALEAALGCPAVHEDDRVAEVQRARREQQNGGVVERRAGQMHVVGARRDAKHREEHAVERRDGIGIERREAAAHALRAAGRPRRVVHDLPGDPLGGRRLGLPVEQLRVGAEAGHAPDREASRRREVDLVDRGAACGCERLRPDEHLGAGVGEDVRDLAAGQVMVDRRQVPAGLRRGEVELDHRRAVRQHRREAVAGTEAERAKTVH